VFYKVKENKERRMKEKQDRLREQQNKKDAELRARQLILKVVMMGFAGCFGCSNVICHFTYVFSFFDMNGTLLLLCCYYCCDVACCSAV